MKSATTCAIALFLGIVLFPMLSGAHGAVEFMKESGGYRIELSTDTAIPEVGVPLRYNLDLFPAATTSKEVDANYDRVWVRLMRGDTLIFSTWLAKPEGLLSGFTYAFPESGEYELTARFVRGEEMLAETSFTITASGTDGMRLRPTYLFLVSGVAFLVGTLLAKWRCGNVR